MKSKDEKWVPTEPRGESNEDAVLRGDARSGSDGGNLKKHKGLDPAERLLPQVSLRDPPVAIFCKGDLVSLRSNSDTVMPVINVIPGGGECRYEVFHKNAREVYYERQLQKAPDEKEKRRLVTAPEVQAFLTARHLQSLSTTNLFSLRSGRIQFVPYQFRPVLKLIRSDRPRLLIADEVGVGKTIEAGLIIKELQARMGPLSVLIICPKPLVAERKWEMEMKRFGETFLPLDGRLLRRCVDEARQEGVWPDQYSKVILPFSQIDSDLLYGRKGRECEGLVSLHPPPKFDLVIVDEASHIRNPETLVHQGVRYFCDNAAAVLLLTATPVQMGNDDLFNLLNVLRPDLVIDRASFDQMAKPNRYINAAVKHCREKFDGWQQEAHARLNEATQTEWGQRFLCGAPGVQEIYDQLNGDTVSDKDRIGLIRGIDDLNTFSSLINRTRRRDIGEFTTRKAQTVAIDFTPDQRSLYDRMLNIVAQILEVSHGTQNVKFMMTTLRRQAASCLYGLAPLLEDMLKGKLDRLEAMAASDNEADIDLVFVKKMRSEIESLLEQSRKLDAQDPKIEAFLKVITEKGALDKNKTLVFSTFRHTLSYLLTHSQGTNLRCGLIHGDVPDEERTELRRRFSLGKNDPDAIDVLLCSEVGCEGLDFQFCDFVINYDLPWNPMRIEQRIGRIDRYGQQSETIGIINFITQGTVDADIYERCFLRIGLFEHALGGNEEILGEITHKIHEIAENFQLTPEERAERLQQLADSGLDRILEERELESKQAELLGLNLTDQTWREEVEAAESYWLSPAAVRHCVATFLSSRLGTGGQHLVGHKPLMTLRVGKEGRAALLDDYLRLPSAQDPVARQWERWLEGGQPNLTITFDQETAVDNPKAVYLSVSHPLVRQASLFLQADQPVYAALSVGSSEIEPGEYRFALYRWRKTGVKTDEALVPVAADPAIEGELLSLLQRAVENGSSSLPTKAEFDVLDARHHAAWSVSQAEHIAQNRLLVEYRIQSLTTSHAARCKAIQDQAEQSTSGKIRLMKQSELARANTDFDRRIAELKRAATSGDIHVSPVIFGVVTVRRESPSIKG